MFGDATERVAREHLHSDDHSWLHVDPMLKMSFQALEWAWRQIWKLIKRGVSLCQHRWSQATPAPVWGASWKELFSNCFIIHLRNLLFVTFSRSQCDGGEREGWVWVNLNRMRHDIIYCVMTMWSGEAGLQIFHWLSAPVRMDVGPLGGAVRLESLLWDTRAQLDPQESTSHFVMSPERCFYSAGFHKLF